MSAKLTGKRRYRVEPGNWFRDPTIVLQMAESLYGNGVVFVQQSLLPSDEWQFKQISARAVFDRS